MNINKKKIILESENYVFLIKQPDWKNIFHNMIIMTQ